MIRSAAYRIAALYSFAYAAATIVLGAGVYWAAHDGLRRQFDEIDPRHETVPPPTP